MPRLAFCAKTPSYSFQEADILAYPQLRPLARPRAFGRRPFRRVRRNRPRSEPPCTSQAARPQRGGACRRQRRHAVFRFDAAAVPDRANAHRNLPRVGADLLGRVPRVACDNGPHPLHRTISPHRGCTVRPCRPCALARESSAVHGGGLRQHRRRAPLLAPARSAGACWTRRCGEGRRRGDAARRPLPPARRAVRAHGQLRHAVPHARVLRLPRPRRGAVLRLRIAFAHRRHDAAFGLPLPHALHAQRPADHHAASVPHRRRRGAPARVGRAPVVVFGGHRRIKLDLLLHHHVACAVRIGIESQTGPFALVFWAGGPS